MAGKKIEKGIINITGKTAVVHIFCAFIKQELKEASKQHPVNYSPPLIMLSCFNGITESLASE